MHPGDTNKDFLQKAVLVSDSIPVILAYCDKDLVCRFANAACCKWLGRRKNKVIGSTVAGLLPDSVYGQYKSYIDGVLNGHTQHFEQSVLTPGSSDIRYQLVSLYPDTGSKGINGFAVHAADITQQKKQVQETSGSHITISNQNKSLQNFANIVSHNLKSYANNLAVLLDMYENENDAEQRLQIFGFLKEMSVDFKSSVENLKEIVKVQNLGKVPTQQVNLHSYVVKTTEMLHIQLKETKATIYNRISPSIHIEANAAYVESIVLNFIDNAIKYRHPDRRPEIELSAMQVGNETVLSIKDNGLGIDLENNRQKLYGMYNTFHGNSNATGLGLFMVKQQVDNMGGYLGVESSVGSGTWFRVYFKTNALA